MNNEIKNSENFIYQKVGKESGFKVSKNYFETIEDNFAIRLFEENINQHPGFETPEGYFDTLEDSLLRKVNIKSKVISLRQKLIQIIPLAAVASVLLFIGINSFQFESTTALSFENITDDAIENWLENNSSSIHTEDIATIVSEVELLDNDFAFTDITDDTIENYLYSSEDATVIQELY